MKDKIFNYIIILILSSYFMRLSLNDDLDKYISSRYFWLSNIATAGLIIVSIFSLVLLFKEIYKKDKFKKISNETRKILDDSKTYTLMLFPALSIISPISLLVTAGLVLFRWKNSILDKKIDNLNIISLGVIIIAFGAIIIPPKTLSADQISETSQSFNSYIGSTSQGSIIDKFKTTTAEYDLGDWIRNINFQSNIYSFEGKAANVSGFITKAENENYFLVSRFAISCCVLDATPIGMYVDYDWQSDFKEGEWVEVKGVIKIDKINGVEELIISPDYVNKISEPDKPYIS